jgi:hypothetical protein
MKQEGPAQDMPPPFALRRMMSGFYVSRAIYVMTQLDIADVLSGARRTSA